jgi:hypothetical protein
LTYYNTTKIFFTGHVTIICGAPEPHAGQPEQPTGSWVQTEAPVSPATPNRTMLDIINQIDGIQAGMEPPKEGKDSLEYLREGREGAMYDRGASE